MNDKNHQRESANTRDRYANKLKHFMRISIIEGIVAQMHLVINAPGSIFVTKFLVLFQATPLQLSIFAAIGQLSQLFQPIGALITKKVRSRKQLTVRYLFFGRIMPFFYGLLPFLFIKNDMIIWLCLIFFFISMSLQAIGGNLWIAWMSDMIPLRIRARFFSARSQYLIVVSLVLGYIISFFLDLFDSAQALVVKIKASFGPLAGIFTPDAINYGFMAVFVFAVILGIASNKILLIQHERPKEIEHEHYITLLFTPLRDKNFAKLLVYGFWWMLSLGIGAPFWTPFMIKKLHMSLIEIQVYGMTNALVSLAVMRVWGKIIDRFGNKNAMRFAILLGGFNPLIWLFLKPENYWIVYIEAITSGIMWAGAGLVGFNFVLAIAPPRKRQIYAGLFGAFSGLAMMITMLISGIFQPSNIRLFGMNLEPEQVLFGIAGLVRWTTQIPLSWIYEARAKPFGEVVIYLIKGLKMRIFVVCRKIFRPFE